MKGKNILLIVGTTVGAGIFSLPIAFKQAGILPFFLLVLILAYVTFKINVYFCEVTQTIKVKHQLPGYVSVVLGKQWGRIALVLQMFATLGALIAFAAIAGTFLSDLVGFSPETGNMLFFILAVALLFFSGKRLENLDELFAAGKGILFVCLVVLAFTFFPTSSYQAPALVGIKPYLAYGLILFSLTGFSIIPELHPEKQYRKSLLIAQLFIVILYLVFTIALSPFVFGDGFVFKNNILAIFVNLTGFISVFTTYLMLSLVSKDILMRDMKVAEKGALGFTALIPFLAIFFHVDGFLEILSLTGGVFLGGVGLLICAMYQTVFPEKNVIERLLIQLLLLTGILLEVIVFAGFIG